MELEKKVDLGQYGTVDGDLSLTGDGKIKVKISLEGHYEFDLKAEMLKYAGAAGTNKYLAIALKAAADLMHLSDAEKAALVAPASVPAAEPVTGVPAPSIAPVAPAGAIS